MLRQPMFTFFLLNQFYSWYIYPENDHEHGKSVSSAEYIDDVNEVHIRLSP